jgi:uncharacterized protein YyaL (SSP411 family)
MRPSQPRPSSRPTRISPAQDTEEATAAGVYGVIVSAAVMAASHAPSAVATVIAVLVTLSIYWAAERYARIVAERIHEGHRPRWHTVRQQLTSGWEMITTSMLPLAVLVVVRLLGADLRAAVIWALVCSTVLLCMAGWHVGRRGRLTRLERFVSTAVAGVFGVGLILLKALLH